MSAPATHISCHMFKLTYPRLFLAFVAHPLLIITLITFTIAPTLLSLRRNLTSRASTIYTALIPQSLPAIPFLDTTGAPKTNKEWLLTLLSGYVGWKTLGTLPSLMILLVLIALWKGREADGDRGWLAKGLREEKTERVQEKGVSTRSERTDLQVVG